MKKFLIILMVFACLAVTAQAALTYGQTYYYRNKGSLHSAGSTDPLYQLIGEVDDIVSGTTGVSFLLFSPTTEPGTPAEGQYYYNAVTQAPFYYNGSSFVQFGTTSAGTSLDGSYDLGSAITVDTSAVTLTVGASDNNAALVITHNETSNNNDAVTIANAGTGDALQISPGAVSGGGINMVSKASGITALITLDGSTNDWDGADNVGQILIQADDPYIHAGATGLMILDSSTPITAAEGFLARFVHSGTAQTNAYAVQIEVPATQPALFMNGGLVVTGQAGAAHNTVAIVGNDGANNQTALTVNNEGTAAAVIITGDDTDTPLANFVGKASATVTLVTVDGDTGDWIGGADDVAMVEIIGGATANANAGGGLLIVTSACTPAASSEGFLARFIHTGSATATAAAVEIEVPATQPALAVDGIVKLNGQTAAGGALLQVAAVGASGNADAMTITNDGSGDCLQITPTDVDSGGINMVGKAAGTVPLIIVDGVTGDWDGANDKGMINITHDTALIHAGASLLHVGQTTAVKSDAEGFLARFFSDATKQSSAFAVEIEVTNQQPALKVNNNVTISGADQSGTLLTIAHIGATGDADAMTIASSGSGDALQISPTDVDSAGLHIIAKVAGTVSLAKLAGGTGAADWDGADNIGMLHLTHDSAVVDAGASQLVILQETATKSDAEGFLARFISTATAQTGSFAVEIETTNTQPALKLNNQLQIAGADSAGILMKVDGGDVTGDSDTIVVTHRGDASALKITTAEPVGTGIEVVCDAAQTSSAVLIDGTTGAWLGASDVGMLHLKSDGGLASVNASLLYINNTGVPTNDSRGSSLRIVDTGNAGAGTAGYAVYIQATDATVEALYIDDGEVLIDEILTTGIGYQSTVVTKVANSDGGGGSTIAPGTRVVHVTGFTANANDWILLPSGTIGERLTIISDVAHEIRTPAASDDTINDVDADGGAAEYAVVLDDINEFVCTGTGASWIAVAHDKLGAAKTIAPD